MKPGSLLLFIDNDGGGFHNLIEDAAIEFNFIPIFGPFRRETYLNSHFKKMKFGYNSCCKTTVTVHVLQKPFVMSPYCNFTHTLVDPYMPPKESFGSPPTPFVYLGRSPDFNANDIPSSARSPLLPLPSPYAGGPATPFMDNSRLGYSSAYDARSEFAHNENIYNGPDFVSTPFGEIPQSPSLPMPSRIATPLTTNLVNSPLNTSFRRAIYTPNSQPSRAGKRARMQGCFPLKISNFRHHVANKLSMFKTQARNVFKKRKDKKNKHPIFKL